MKKDIVGCLPGQPKTRRIKQINFGCSNLNKLCLIRRDFWPDLDPESIEHETECINRLGREEEYINGVGPGGSIPFVCIPYFVVGHDKPFYLYHEALLRSQMWHIFRKKIISTTPFCESCGSKKRLEIHHLTYRGFYSFFNPENVMVLCRSCHSWVHRG